MRKTARPVAWKVTGAIPVTRPDQNALLGGGAFFAVIEHFADGRCEGGGSKRFG